VKRRDNVFETPPADAEAPLDLMAVLMADFPTPKFTVWCFATNQFEIQSVFLFRQSWNKLRYFCCPQHIVC
jgi:hypothetical protein